MSPHRGAHIPPNSEWRAWLKQWASDGAIIDGVHLPGGQIAQYVVNLPDILSAATGDLPFVCFWEVDTPNAAQTTGLWLGMVPDMPFLSLEIDRVIAVCDADVLTPSVLSTAGTYFAYNRSTEPTWTNDNIAAVALDTGIASPITRDGIGGITSLLSSSYLRYPLFVGSSAEQTLATAANDLAPPFRLERPDTGWTGVGLNVSGNLQAAAMTMMVYGRYQPDPARYTP